MLLPKLLPHPPLPCFWHRKAKAEVIPTEMSNTFGGVQHFVDTHSKEALVERGKFGLHSTFVCGTPKINAETQASPRPLAHLTPPHPGLSCKDNAGRKF